MVSKPRLIIGGIAGAALLAFLFGMIFTTMILTPAREPGAESATGTAEPTTSPHVSTTPAWAMPTPTSVVLIILTPTQKQPTPVTPTPSITATPTERPTVAPSPTPTPRFPFYYREASMVPEDNCSAQYLQGWVRDATGASLDGVTIRWERWGIDEFYVSGSDATAPRGEWKFTYMPGNAGLETDFVLQIVESEENPEPRSKPLVIHYAGCHETGQITNIVFKRQW